jgi:anti-sigma factor RsiW
MTDPEFFEILARYQDGPLTPEALESLERALREDPERRRHFAEWQLRSMALHDYFRQEAFRVPAPTPVRGRKTTWASLRPLLAAVAGLVIGLFGASVVWAISTPDWIATASRVAGFGDAGFEQGSAGLIEPGFPRTTGRWSGDEAALVEVAGAHDGRRVLQFVSPGADVAVPGGRAISCDVFQLVDLRSLRAAAAGEGEAMLELSANFRDGRAEGTKPSVTFMAQIFLFSGDLATLHQAWPNNLGEALASGAAFVHTMGEAKPEWHRLGAKCLVPPGADFAVIQLAARPNLRPAELESLFADEVALTLTTRPDLPVKVLE